MKRRAILGVLGAGAISTGWLGTPSGRIDEGTLAERFDCEQASRPECGAGTERERDRETASDERGGVTTYPDPPAAFTDDVVVAFVREYERAYADTDARCSRTRADRTGGVRLSFDESRPIDWYDEIRVVRLRYVKTSAGSDDRGASRPTADDYGGVVYGVDETAVVRTAFPVGPADGVPNESETPDPVGSGRLLECFR